MRGGSRGCINDEREGTIVTGETRETAARGERLTYIDVLKLVGSVFVVFMHSASDALWTDPGGYGGWYLLAGLSSLSFCAVPLFFMMSGFLLSARPCSVSVLLRKRIPRLAGALLFWSLLYVLFDLLTGGGESGVSVFRRFWSVLQSPVNISLWYMYALIPMYLISPVLIGGLNALDRTGRRLILTIILILELLSAVRIAFPDFYFGYLLFEVVDYLLFFKGYLCAFVLGWYLSREETRVSRSVTVPAALLTLAVIVLGTIRRSLAAGSYDTGFQSQSAGYEVLLALCLFLIAKESRLKPSAKAEKLLSLLSAQTLNIYLMHNLLLLILYKRLIPLSSSAVLLCSAAVWLAALAVSLALNGAKRALFRKKR